MLKAFRAQKASQDAEQHVCTQDDSLWQGTQRLQNTGEHSEGPPVCVGDDGLSAQNLAERAEGSLSAWT